VASTITAGLAALDGCHEKAIAVHLHTTRDSTASKLCVTSQSEDHFPPLFYLLCNMYSIEELSRPGGGFKSESDIGQDPRPAAFSDMFGPRE
jgi:hypothetical protein